MDRNTLVTNAAHLRRRHSRVEGDLAGGHGRLARQASARRGRDVRQRAGLRAGPVIEHVDVPSSPTGEGAARAAHSTRRVAAEELCHIQGNRFDGGALVARRGPRHFSLDGRAVRRRRMVTSASADVAHRALASAPHALPRDRRRRRPGQVRPLQLEARRSSDDTGCKFTYEDDTVEHREDGDGGRAAVRARVETKVTNLADAPKKHAFRSRRSPSARTKRSKGTRPRLAVRDGAPVRARRRRRSQEQETTSKRAGSSKQAPIASPRCRTTTSRTRSSRRRRRASPRRACDVLAEDWVAEGQKRDDDEAGAVYHARLAYPPRDPREGRERHVRADRFLRSEGARRPQRPLADPARSSATSSTSVSSHRSRRCSSASSCCCTITSRTTGASRSSCSRCAPHGALPAPVEVDQARWSACGGSSRRSTR